MIKRILSIAALSMMVAACGGDDAAEGDASVDSTSVTTMPGTDTVTAPVVVPTTDSVVTTTTTDTVHGQATEATADSVAATTTTP
jgi:hypothetical protein